MKTSEFVEYYEHAYRDTSGFASNLFSGAAFIEGLVAGAGDNIRDTERLLGIARHMKNVGHFIVELRRNGSD